MFFTLWFVVIGLLLIAMALSATLLKRLPLSTSMLYLVAGYGLGPEGMGLIRVDPLADLPFLEHFTEIAIIVSLFTAGLKLRLSLRDRRWFLPFRLASISMAITVGLVAVAGVQGLGLPLGAAILLGAILSPTDPVLASDVQVADPTDADRLRFGLTGEAGLNDGTAFPFVMLGLGLLGFHDLGVGGVRWLSVDVIWSVLGGLGIGGVLGMLVARLALYLRQAHREALGLDDFLALGLIALSYGLALLGHASGFLSVFAAGLALRRVERLENRVRPPEDVRDAAQGEVGLAVDPEKGAAYMAGAVLGFNQQLERILEVGVVLLIGGMLRLRDLPAEALWFVPLLLLVIRPIAVVLGLIGAETPRLQLRLMAWFGIRGVGSIYYLVYAIGYGLPSGLAERLLDLTLSVVAVSIVVHGISVTPLMARYRERSETDPEVG